jgi:hypothetical protein
MSEEIITEKEDIHNGIDFLKPDKKLKPISKRFASEFKTFDTIKENTKKSYKSSVRCMHYYYTGIKLTDEDDIIKMIISQSYKNSVTKEIQQSDMTVFMLSNQIFQIRFPNVDIKVRTKSLGTTTY